jgi:hypothetical protein
MSALGGQKCPKRLRLPAGKNTHEQMGRIVRKTGSRTAYSITSSAVARIEGGTVIPRALAVLRLMTMINFVGI